MIKKTFNLKKLVATMPDLFKNFVNTHGAGINDAIQNGIDLSEDIHGRPFKSMSPVTEAIRNRKSTGNKLLDESGEMRKTKLEKATRDNLVFSITNVGKNSDGEYYGTFHNTGDGVPKREWFGIPKESKPGGSDYNKRKEVLLRMIRQAWRKY
tara:strand:+ start:1107 stop:1565 length:459 start_codon:yes stop_codon:yes gene_type:complete